MSNNICLSHSVALCELKKNITGSDTSMLLPEYSEQMLMDTYHNIYVIITLYFLFKEIKNLYLPFIDYQYTAAAEHYLKFNLLAEENKIFVL